MLSINRQWPLAMGCLLMLGACMSPQLHEGESPQHHEEKSPQPHEGKSPQLHGEKSPQPEEQTPHHPQKNIKASDQAWQEYRDRSAHWRSVDREALQAEVSALGLDEAKIPRRTHRFGFDVDQPEPWYATEEGRRIADILVSFQTPSGGWSKRTDMGHRPRQPGEHFGHERHYVPTFDNDATTTQITILAHAYNATQDVRYQEAYERGVKLILEAQYPNGGWPQSFPLRGGYHDHITLNDEVFENNLSLLYRVSRADPPFESAPNKLQEQSRQALTEGLDMVVAAQVVVNGEPTIWGAQHDAKTLEPREARAYEMVALATSESVSLLDFLMDIETPSEAIQHSIHSAMTWYEANKITGYIWDSETREIIPEQGAEPIWSRFAQIGTNRPLFGDRDGSVNYDIEDISQERRDGYGWYTHSPNRVLKKYALWREQFPR